MTIRENLLELRRALEEWPEEHFDLKYIVRERSCGTLYCAAGLVGITPYFQALGYSLNRDVLMRHGKVAAYHTCEDFGMGSWGRLFERRQLGGFDSQLTKDSKEGLDETVTDKMLALARIDKQLELYP